MAPSVPGGWGVVTTPRRPFLVPASAPHAVGRGERHRRDGVTHNAGAAAPVWVVASGPAPGRHLVRRHSVGWGPLFVHCPHLFNSIDCSFVLGQVSKCRCCQRGALVLFSGRCGSRRLPLRLTPPRLPLPWLPLRAAASTAWCDRGPCSCGVALWGSRQDSGSPHSPPLYLSNPWERGLALAWPHEMVTVPADSLHPPCQSQSLLSRLFLQGRLATGARPELCFTDCEAKDGRVFSAYWTEGNTRESQRLWENYRDTAPNAFSPVFKKVAIQTSECLIPALPFAEWATSPCREEQGCDRDRSTGFLRGFHGIKQSDRVRVGQKWSTVAIPCLLCLAGTHSGLPFFPSHCGNQDFGQSQTWWGEAPSLASLYLHSAQPTARPTAAADEKCPTGSAAEPMFLNCRCSTYNR